MHLEALGTASHAAGVGVEGGRLPEFWTLPQPESVPTASP